MFMFGTHKTRTALMTLTAVALFATLPAQSLYAQSSWKEYKARVSGNIGAEARFHKVSSISINYQLKPRVINSGSDKMNIAQIAINLSETSTPITMSCDIHSSHNAQQGAFAENVTSQPCIDITQAQSTQLLHGGDRYVRRIRVNSQQAREAKHVSDTMVINFSYL